MKTKIFSISIFAISVFLFSCGNKHDANNQKPTISLTNYKYPDRIKTSNIYEVNIRQYTAEGTFKAFETHIPRLKKMGVDILWLMPIQPIGQKNRKGSKGSYYSVKNYVEVNPEFGTFADFDSMIKTAHKNGMLVILDWVANHTAWDHIWMTEHSDWYTKDSTGKVIAPVPDWTDVADLNFDKPELRKEMVNEMKFWIEKYDVDGFRCDVAMMIPTTFWDSARVELNKVKPVFMLAEAEQTDHMKNAFDMNYAWNFHHILNEISKGKMNVENLKAYIEKDKTEYEKSDLRMNFTSNHDENSWNGTEYDRMPESYKTFAVLTFTFPGMPLIYSGQEAGLNRMLKFFEKDSINWSNLEMADFYSNLINLKNKNKALWNGDFGGDIQFINNSNPKNVISFRRIKDNNIVLVIMNLSAKPVKFNLIEKDVEKTYIDYFTNEERKIKPQENYNLKAWEYQVLILK